MIPDVGARIASESRVLVVVAGPNGAGKSTFVETFLGALDLGVVNPDAIARALSPTDPGAVAYGREALTFVDHAFLFDNSSAEEPYRFVAEFGRAV